MAVVYSLTPEMRKLLKEPLGILIRGSFSETMSQFKSLLQQEKPRYIISVGDTVSRNLLENGIKPHLAIVDNLAMRKATKSVHYEADRIIHVKNPAGMITAEALTAVGDAVKGSEQTMIVVEGEEDLLTLVAVLYAPENTLVLYGQPYEGVVIIKVTSAKRNEIDSILRIMEVRSKPK